MKAAVLEWFCLYGKPIIYLYYRVRYRTYAKQRTALFILQHLRLRSTQND